MCPDSFVEDICTTIDNKELTVGILIDLSKAFSKVNREILLQKLFHYGIRGVAHEWFVSYLKTDSNLFR